MTNKNGKTNGEGHLENGDNGRDPTTGQFLKGWKGGPGRPKGSVDVLSVMRRRCKEEGLDFEEMVWSVMKAAAEAGSAEKPDAASARTFLDRACGPVKQAVDVTSDGNQIGPAPSIPTGRDLDDWFDKVIELRNGGSG